VQKPDILKISVQLTAALAAALCSAAADYAFDAVAAYVKGFSYFPPAAPFIQQR
jgi:hypothetical protein